MWRSLGLAAAVAVLVPAAAAQTPELASVNSREVQANDHATYADVSATGRWVAFDSAASNLSPRVRVQGDLEVYLRDRRRGRTRLASVGSREQTGNRGSWQPSLSPGGRFLAWCSSSTNFARPDTHPGPPQYPRDPYTDVFVRDLRRGVTRRASEARDGGMANEWSCEPDVADTGDAVFLSAASNLVRGDRNGVQDVFVYDWSSRRVRRLTRLGGDTPSISGNGRRTAWWAQSRLFTARRGHAPRMASGARVCPNPSVVDLTRSGRHLLFSCEAGHVHVVHLATGSTVLASPTLDGAPPAIGGGITAGGISADARTVAFCGDAANLALGDGVGDDVFVRALGAGTTRLLTPGDGPTDCLRTTTVSANGRLAVFHSDLPGLTPADVGDQRKDDVFALPLR